MSEIGVLRLQPKVLKLEKINASNVQEKLKVLYVRDPIKIIQKILDKIFIIFCFILNRNLSVNLGLSPLQSQGFKKLISRIKQSTTGDWGSSIELAGDFSDLYSNCNCTLLTECVKQACSFSNFHESSFQYVRLLINCIMTHSYLKSQTGFLKL